MTRSKPCFLMVASVLSLAVVLRADVDPAPVRKLLSDNPAGPDVPSVLTGATYRFEGPFTVSDPAGGSWPERMRGRALVDGGTFGGWWSTTQIEGEPGLVDVVFDLQRDHHVAAVEVQARGALEQIFVDIGGRPRELKAVDGRRHVVDGLDQASRLVRLSIRKSRGTLYVEEVLVYGEDLPADLSATGIRSGLRGDELVLAEGGRPTAAIVVARAAGRGIREQAHALQGFVEQMTGATLPLVDDRARGLPDVVICVGQAHLGHPGIDGGEPDLEPQRLLSMRDNMIILGGGGGPRAAERARYAVHGFLRLLGAEAYRDDPLYIVVPKRDRLAIPATGLLLEAPRFLARAPCSPMGAWSSAGGETWAMAHNWSQVVPHDRYGVDHPEYFGLIDGHRDGNVLCTAGRAVIDLFAQEAARAFAGGAGAFSLTPNDGSRTFCRCHTCVPDKDMRRPDADRLLFFANDVRLRLNELYPDFQDHRLHVLAGYGWPEHRIPPTKGVRALPGVVLWVAHQGCHAHTWDDPHCPINREWAEQMRGWRAAAPTPLGNYEYACFSNYNWDRKWSSFPVVSVRRVVHDIKAYHQAGFGWLYYESEAGRSRYKPFRWVNAYATDRAMADPGIDPDQLLRQLCDDLYGPGSAVMYEHYDLLQTRLEQTTHHAGNWYLPDPAKVYSHGRPDLDGSPWQDDITRLTALVNRAVWLARGVGGDILDRCLEAQKVWYEAVASLRSAERDKHGPKQFNDPPW